MYVKCVRHCCGRSLSNFIYSRKSTTAHKYNISSLKLLLCIPRPQKDGKKYVDPGLRLTARCFPEWIPAKPGAKRAHPVRACRACNPPKRGVVGVKRRHTSFWCATCQVALCIPTCFYAYHNYKNFKRYVETPATAGCTPESSESAVMMESYI